MFITNQGYRWRLVLLLGCGFWGISVWLTPVLASEQLSFYAAYENGKAGISGLKGAYAVLNSPDGRFIYAAGYKDDAVAVLARNPNSGALSFAGVTRQGDAGVTALGAPYALALSPDAQYLYVAAYKDDAIAVFKRNLETGLLTPVASIHNGQDAQGLDGVEAIAISRDGRHLYAVGFTDHALAVFSRDAASGKLTFIEVHQEGKNGHRGLSDVRLSPDGKQVYVAAFDTHALLSFTRNPDTGQLTRLETLVEGQGVSGLYGVDCLVLSEDGLFLYAGSFVQGELSLFKRAVSNGKLTPVNVLKRPELQGVKALALSPDGSHLYAASRKAHAVTAFSRHPSTGQLAYVDTFKDGVGGLRGLRGAYALTFSVDGEQLYVAAHFSNAVAVFTRLH